MPIDGLLFTALTAELRRALVNARVQSVHQPRSTDILLTLRQPGETLQLLISAHPEAARIHLTRRSFDNPLTPPAFCLLLRKHLIPGRVVAIRQPRLERLAEIVIEGFAEDGGRSERILAAEVMGRHSNIVLIDAKDGLVVDALKRIPHSENSYREILPGRPYVPPPPQEKLDPAAAAFEEFEPLVRHAGPSVPLERALQRAVMGMSPLAARAVLARAGVPEGAAAGELGEEAYRALWRALRDVTGAIDRGECEPAVVEAGGKADFWCFPGPFPVLKTGFSSLQQLLDEHYAAVEEREAVRARRAAVESALRQSRVRVERKMELQRRSIEEAGRADEFRKAGDLLTANLHRLRDLPSGTSSVTLDDFDPDAPPVTLALDPKLSASENAREYYRKYQKAKKTLQKAAEQLQASQSELEYLASVETALGLAQAPAEVEEVFEELAREGYLEERPAPPGKSKRQSAPSEPIRVVSSDGFEIAVGRNNRQNDRLTLKEAGPDDLWLHTKEIPGAHVVVFAKGAEVPERTLREAAILAALHSKAKHSANVPVDYTLCRHVRKPKGGKPGMVIYENHRTVFVTPDEGVFDRLKTESERVRR